MKKSKKKRKYPTVTRDETKVAMGSEYDFPPHIASICEELWSYNFHEGADLVGLRLVRDEDPVRPNGHQGADRPNRGSLFFDKAGSCELGWTDHNAPTECSKFLSFRLAREGTVTKEGG